MLFKSALLHRRSDEWFSVRAADKRFDLLGAAAFQTQNAESGE